MRSSPDASAEHNQRRPISNNYYRESRRPTELLYVVSISR
ncbi:TPA: hypothetical protein N0F65_006896 [Lagenidium giganteum]|uniref:Uncharacterized protein n=1 Tax=Lagenidium giganteum TaxID=4803 RepID=A0AAV2ZJW6_9STRA|nr:TPA: hypothetical protein N0F65_006896 [Lagenidium giganteum]